MYSVKWLRNKGFYFQRKIKCNAGDKYFSQYFEELATCWEMQDENVLLSRQS
jgi:hypothetical protein